MVETISALSNPVLPDVDLLLSADLFAAILRGQAPQTLQVNRNTGETKPIELIAGSDENKATIRIDRSTGLVSSAMLEYHHNAHQPDTPHADHFNKQQLHIRVEKHNQRPDPELFQIDVSMSMPYHSYREFIHTLQMIHRGMPPSTPMVGKKPPRSRQKWSMAGTSI